MSSPEAKDGGPDTAARAAAGRSDPFDVSPRAAGALGLGATAVILLGALVTAIPYVGYAGEGYSPLNHFISELGETGRSQLAPVFNAGIVIGAIGLGLFLLILSRRLTGRYRPALMLAGIVAGTSGALVGIFPMDTHAVHRLVSSVFFCTGWIVVAVFSVWLARRRPSGYPRWLLAPGAISVAIFFVFLAVYSTYRPIDPDAPIVVRSAIWTVPLLEWASLLSLLLWFVCVSLVLVRRPTWPSTER
jgi:hypothetical membrane protein